MNKAWSVVLATVLVAGGTTVAVQQASARASGVATVPIDTPFQTAEPEQALAPGAPAVPPAPRPVPGDGHWTYAAHGLAVDVRVVPPGPVAGQLVTWTVRMASTAGECCAAQVLYGDGQGAPERDTYCATERPGRAGATQVFRHAYRRAGTYTPWLTILRSCRTGTATVTIKPTVRVARGPVLSNGPWLPVATLAHRAPEAGEDPRREWFEATAYDHDGAPVSWTFDWGDGTAEHVPDNREGCTWPDDGGWVEQSAYPKARHEFAPGTYTVTFTVTTAGCNGKDPQTATATATWTQS